MRRNQGVASLLIAGGLLLVMVGQYFYWCPPGRNFRNIAPTVFQEKHTVPQPLPEGAFAIKDVEILPQPKEETQPDSVPVLRQVIVRVRLTNCLRRPVTILGGTSGCTREGCHSVLLDGPMTMAPGQSHWVAIDVKWTRSPASPLAADLFTDVSLAATIELEILPGSAEGEAEVVRICIPPCDKCLRND